MNKILNIVVFVSLASTVVSSLRLHSHKLSHEYAESPEQLSTLNLSES